MPPSAPVGGIGYNSPPMARSWQYSRSRRTLMQVIMWLVLAATVGGASLLTRQRLQSRMVQPEKAVRLLAVEVRLPARWQHGTVQYQQDNPDRMAMTSAVEFGRRSRRDTPRFGGRHLVIQEEVVPDGTTIVGYMSRHGGDELRELPAEQLADFGGQPGWMVVVPAERGDDGRGTPWGIYAGAILPPNRAVMIQMMGPGTVVQGDMEDVRRLAANVRFVGGVPLIPGARTRPATQPAQ
jgi:hypothetical protein